jgi:hypothetical protein
MYPNPIFMSKQNQMSKLKLLRGLQVDSLGQTLKIKFLRDAQGDRA